MVVAVQGAPSFTIVRALTQKRRPSRKIRYRQPGPGACPDTISASGARSEPPPTSSSPCPRGPLCSVAQCAYVPSPKRSGSPHDLRRWLDAHKKGACGASAPTTPHLVTVHLGLVCVRKFFSCYVRRSQAPCSARSPCRRLYLITSAGRRVMG